MITHDASLIKLAAFFADQTYSKASINDIAKLLKISTGSFYKTFGNKKSFYFKVVDYLKKQVLTELDIARESDANSLSEMIEVFVTSKNAQYLVGIINTHQSDDSTIVDFLKDIELILFKKIESLIRNNDFYMEVIISKNIYSNVYLFLIWSAIKGMNQNRYLESMCTQELDSLIDIILLPVKV